MRDGGGNERFWNWRSPGMAVVTAGIALIAIGIALGHVTPWSEVMVQIGGMVIIGAVLVRSVLQTGRMRQARAQAIAQALHAGEISRQGTHTASLDG